MPNRWRRAWKQRQSSTQLHLPDLPRLWWMTCIISSLGVVMNGNAKPCSWLRVHPPALWPVTFWFWAKASFLARKCFLFVKEYVKQHQVKNDFFTQSWNHHKETNFAAFTLCVNFFPHSSIHCLKQWGQCWPAKNSAIHMPCTLHSAYTC